MATQNASGYLANTLLNAMTVIAVGLSSTPPTIDGGNVNQPGQADYVRATPTFAAASGRKRLTTTTANFVNGGGAAAANGGTFGWATFYDSATLGAGNFLGSCQLSQALSWTAGLGVTMAAGDVSVEFEAS